MSDILTRLVDFLHRQLGLVLTTRVARLSELITDLATPSLQNKMLIFILPNTSLSFPNALPKYGTHSVSTVSSEIEI